MGDERICAYGDEVSLCLRIVERRWRIALAQGALVANTGVPSDDSALVSFLTAPKQHPPCTRFRGVGARLCSAAVVLLRAARRLLPHRGRAIRSHRPRESPRALLRLHEGDAARPRIVLRVASVVMRPLRQRIAIVTPSLGGTEGVLAEEVKRWAARFEVRVFANDVMGGDIPTGSLVRVPNGVGPHLLRYLWWFAANGAGRWLDGSRSDAIVSAGVNCLDADAIGIHIVFAKYWEQVRDRLALERRSLRTFPRALQRTAYVSLIRLLERRVYSGPALLWTASHADAVEVESRFGQPPGSVVVVPHGVDAETFHPAKREERRVEARRDIGVKGNEFLLLLVGNDLAKQGADLALSALARLPRHVRLAIAGRVAEGEVNRLVVGAGVPDRVLVLPQVDDPLTYYAAADVLVAPSREDAYLPPLEAMACGLPVVVSAEAGVAELVTPDREAVVLQDPTDVDAILGAVERVVDDSRFAKDLAANGRALAERCTWDANAERTGDLIERELRTPRVLVLAPDPGGIGGIQRASRVAAPLALRSLRGGSDRHARPSTTRSRAGPRPGSAPGPGRGRHRTRRTRRARSLRGCFGGDDPSVAPAARRARRAPAPGSRRVGGSPGLGRPIRGVVPRHRILGAATVVRRAGASRRQPRVRAERLHGAPSREGRGTVTGVGACLPALRATRGAECGGRRPRGAARGADGRAAHA